MLGAKIFYFQQPLFLSSFLCLVPWEEKHRCKKYGSANICSTLLWCGRQKSMKSRPAQKKTDSYRKQWPDDSPFTSLWTLVRTDIRVTCALDLHVFWKILNHLQTRKIGNSYVKSPIDFFLFYRK